MITTFMEYQRISADMPQALENVASRLSDQRFKEFAETFNFVRYGEATMAFSRTQSGTVDRYLQQPLEEVAGQNSEGVRLALYFRRKAPGLESASAGMNEAESALKEAIRTLSRA